MTTAYTGFKYFLLLAKKKTLIRDRLLRYNKITKLYMQDIHGVWHIRESVHSPFCS